jgi:hypothetical protein
MWYVTVTVWFRRTRAGVVHEKATILNTGGDGVEDDDGVDEGEDREVRLGDCGAADWQPVTAARRAPTAVMTAIVIPELPRPGRPMSLMFRR